jgi:hypothetical protein
MRSAQLGSNDKETGGKHRERATYLGGPMNLTGYMLALILTGLPWVPSPTSIQSIHHIEGEKGRRVSTRPRRRGFRDYRSRRTYQVERRSLHDWGTRGTVVCQQPDSEQVSREES